MQSRYFLTNRPNAAFESSDFPSLPPALLSQQTAASQGADTREDEHFYEVDYLCPVVEQFFFFDWHS